MTFSYEQHFTNLGEKTQSQATHIKNGVVSHNGRWISALMLPCKVHLRIKCGYLVNLELPTNSGWKNLFFLNQETFPFYHEWVPNWGHRTSASKVWDSNSTSFSCMLVISCSKFKHKPQKRNPPKALTYDYLLWLT